MVLNEASSGSQLLVLAAPAQAVDDEAGCLHLLNEALQAAGTCGSALGHAHGLLDAGEPPFLHPQTALTWSRCASTELPTLMAALIVPEGARSAIAAAIDSRCVMAMPVTAWWA
jgi:hypothetical protein